MEDEPRDAAYTKLEQKLGNLAARAVLDYDMIADGDRIMVAVSGGKDSYALLRLLRRMRGIAPVKFELIALHVDDGYAVAGREHLRVACREMEIPFDHVERGIWDIIRDKLRPGTTACSLCSRLRRGILYTEAQARGCTKLALGHHKDDLIHTFLLNILFTGQIKTMAPKLLSDDGKNVVIRPLAYCPEEKIAQYTRGSGFEPVTCERCEAAITKRNDMAELTQELERRFPGARDSLFASLKHVRLTHVLDPGRAGQIQKERP